MMLTDTSGNVQTTYTYGPFGNTLTSGASNDNPYKFGGREADPVAPGMYYLRSRFLDSGLSRFVSRDPAGFRGGGHLYNYAGNAPTMAIDPTGYDPNPYQNGGYFSPVGQAVVWGVTFDAAAGFLEGFAGHFTAVDPNSAFSQEEAGLEVVAIYIALTTAPLDPLAAGIAAYVLTQAAMDGFRAAVLDAETDSTGAMAYLTSLALALQNPNNLGGPSKNWSDFLKEVAPPTSPRVSAPAAPNSIPAGPCF